MKKLKNKDIKTRVIDNTLVVSLISSPEPRLLRIDMAGGNSTTIKIKENKEEYLLVALSGDNNETEIEKFENKESALTMLKHIAESMFSHDGKNPAKKSKFLINLLKVIVLIAIVYLLITFFNKDLQKPVIEKGTISVPQEDIGKPVPLDDLLN